MDLFWGFLPWGFLPGDENTNGIRNDNNKQTNFRRVEERGAIVGFLTGLAFVAWIGYFSFLATLVALHFTPVSK